MAVNSYSSSAQISLQKYGSFMEYTNKELMSKRCCVPQKTAPVGPVVLRITSSIKNKIYEDQSQGIICYEDESGEIICEGYDEGPRYHRIPSPTQHPRDVEIMNLQQQQSWLQIVKGEEINHLAKGALHLQEDLNYNKWL
ncbi:hypothetical protein AAZX31_07G043900 [Glycine max]|uniref:Uncharacterized protein n=1 Tax=Glycine max TaxID=3847 RepID=C6T044_SOYBN|nr:uncharacterized protein LOC100306604 [Glycine max]XP_028239263.1 uncharacterized protein LOC114418220 isoform X1 [Glycine soja]ACU14867.1 unknown [Glycine max]KAG5021637.1 hypothetical protein JHK85_017979 [Glycine max]KAH1085394.1 hypothetical protein GYH30_017400 [Glycine max]KAH1240628.1 hypothetical protein GmHk_07G018438 [Glycine max]KRH47716.1 hypothetical protein GLYMA_07G045700v4 [Glycine max]|eukprot:NP_001237403.1 uncharacterized protein LOC100306604 [Glycine max]